MKWRRVFKHPFFKLAVAAAILAWLYWAADWRAVGRAIAGLDGWLLAAALALFIPQTLVSARRWQIFVAPIDRIAFGKALHQTLLASAANLVLPSKLGDATKATMLDAAIGPAALRVVFEKINDVAALAVLLLIGALGWRMPGPTVCVAALAAVILATRFMRRGLAKGFLLAAGYSLLLWVLHLAQIDLFLRAADVVVPWPTALARVPVAIFAGLLPITLWGVGTRDSMLIWMFADVASASTMAAVGLLTALRYLVPGVAGLAWIGWRAGRDWRREHARTTTYLFDGRGRAYEADSLPPGVHYALVLDQLPAPREKPKSRSSRRRKARRLSEESASR